MQGSVEEPLKELLEVEMQKLTYAIWYKCDEQRMGYCNGCYNCNFTTIFGNVTRKMPKLKGIAFEKTAFVERYRFHESRVEAALNKMYLEGVFFLYEMNVI